MWRTRVVSVFILFVMLSSAVLVYAIREKRDVYTIEDMIEWSAQYQTYDQNGNPVPIDGTPFIQMVRDGGGEFIGSTEPRAYQLKKETQYAKIYVDSGSNPYPNNTVINNLGTNFDNIIYPNDTAWFGSTGYSYKTSIYIYNFGDGVGGTGGYYNGGNKIYIDSADLPVWGLSITAHEFQHLIHHSHDWNEHLWVNEGCSELAMKICYGPNAAGLNGHLGAFAMNPDNDLTKFDNRMYDYGSAYAFLAYFAEHYGGKNTIKALVDDGANGISGFRNRLSGKSFETVFHEWTVANYMNNMSISPVYGYNDIKIKAKPEKIVSSYPMSGSGSVNRWAAEYVVFRAGGGSELTVNFDGSTSAMAVYVGKVGKTKPSSVDKLNLDSNHDARFTVKGMGTNYSEVVLIISSESSSISYQYTASVTDHVPPITSVILNPYSPNGPDGWYITKPTITMKTNENKCTIYYHWDNETDRIYNGVFYAPEGIHTLYYHAVDFSGNIEVEKSLTIKVDTTPPTTSIDISPKKPDGMNGWYVTPPNITLTSEEGATIYYKWDSKSEKTYNGPITAPEGKHTLTYYAVDEHTIKESEKKVTLKVDSIAPNSWMIVVPEEPNGENGWYCSEVTISLDCDSGARIFYAWDDDIPREYTETLIAPEGVHTLKYYAEDTAGNREKMHEVEFKVDTISPETYISVSPQNPDGENDWYVSRPIVEFSTNEDGAEIYYQIDDAMEKKYDQPIMIDDGEHIITYYSKDVAGNEDDKKKVTLKVDTKPPKTSMKTNIEDEDGWYSEPPTITLQCEEDDCLIYYFWDSKEENEYESPFKGIPGKHTLTFYAVDEAGNIEPENKVEFKVDDESMKPVVIISVSPTTGFVGETFVIDASKSKDVGSGIDSYRYIVGSEDSGWVRDDSYEYKATSEGRIDIVVKVRDKVGNEDYAKCRITVEKKLQPVYPVPGDEDEETQKHPNLLGKITQNKYFPYAVLALILLLIIGIAATAASRSRKRKKENLEIERASWREVDKRHSAFSHENEILSSHPPSLEAPEPAYKSGFVATPTYSDVEMTMPYTEKVVWDDSISSKSPPPAIPSAQKVSPHESLSHKSQPHLHTAPEDVYHLSTIKTKKVETKKQKIEAVKVDDESNARKHLPPERQEEGLKKEIKKVEDDIEDILKRLDEIAK